MLSHPVAAMTNSAKWHWDDVRKEAAREHQLRQASLLTRRAPALWWGRVRASFGTGFHREKPFVLPVPMPNR